MADTLQFFKKNPDRWLTVKEVSDGLNKNLRTVRSNVQNLMKSNLLVKQEVEIGGKVGIVTKYKFAGNADSWSSLKQIQKTEQYMRHRNILGDYMSQHILLTMLIEEVKGLREDMKKLKEKKK